MARELQFRQDQLRGAGAGEQDSLLKQFKRTYIEITTACNLSCTFCPGTSRSAQFLSVLKFDEILARLGDYSKHIYFHVLGEPLLHPACAALLDRAHAHGKLVNCVTNGTLIGKVGDMLVSKPALRQVTFSMHSFAANNTPVVRDYFEPILDFTRKAQHNHFICYRLWPKDESADPSLTAEILARIETAFRLPFSLPEKLRTTWAVPLDKNVFLNQSRRFDWPDTTGPENGDHGFCLGLREQFAVLVDGTVVPCCLDRNADMALGNIFEESIAEILDGERARRIVDGFSQRNVVEELCRRCSYRKRFD
jgi:radical SAM protein with 4Fe4S-binding SPASM domain